MKIFGRPLELVILDVDGVILELVEPVKRCLESLARDNALPIEPIHRYFDEVAAGVRHGYTNFLDEGIQALWPSLKPEDVVRFAWRFQELKCLDPWPAIKGSTETLAWLRGTGVTLALCTSNDTPTLGRILEHVGIDLSMFKATSTWETEFRKPDPRCLDPMFETIGVPRKHALYIGDWYPDLKVAWGAGVQFLAVLSGGIPRHAFVNEGVPDDHIVERLADLLKLITE